MDSAGKNLHPKAGNLSVGAAQRHCHRDMLAAVQPFAVDCFGLLDAANRMTAQWLVEVVTVHT